MILPHVQKTQQNEECGTELEIIAAANLFQCSVICFSRVDPGNSIGSAYGSASRGKNDVKDGLLSPTQWSAPVL